MDSFDPEEFEAGKPIPYVLDLSMTGLLTIGWDSWMSVPPDYKNLIENTTKVASMKADKYGLLER